MRPVRGIPCALLTLFAGAASAHPMDEVVQSAYLTLMPSAVFLELELTPGPEVASALLGSLDPNADRRITNEEAHAYAQRVLQDSKLTIDGAAVEWALQEVVVPFYENIELASDIVRIYAISNRFDRAGSHTLGYNNQYRPAKSQCIANIFMQHGLGWRHHVTRQSRSDDGRRITVNYFSEPEAVR